MKYNNKNLQEKQERQLSVYNSENPSRQREREMDGWTDGRTDRILNNYPKQNSSAQMILLKTACLVHSDSVEVKLL